MARQRRRVRWGPLVAAARLSSAAPNATDFWDAWHASINTRAFDPQRHDPRGFEFEGLRLEERRRLEDNSCPNADGVCCSLCKQGLTTCNIMAGFLVQDKYYPSEPAVTGSCASQIRRVARCWKRGGRR